MVGWVKQGSVLAQMPCCCPFTCHSSSPYPTSPRSIRTSAFYGTRLWCVDSPQATPRLGSSVAAQKQLCREKQPALRMRQPHHTCFAELLLRHGEGLTLTCHKGSTLAALLERTSQFGFPQIPVMCCEESQRRELKLCKCRQPGDSLQKCSCDPS